MDCLNCETSPDLLNDPQLCFSVVVRLPDGPYFLDMKGVCPPHPPLHTPTVSLSLFAFDYPYYYYYYYYYSAVSLRLTILLRHQSP